MTEKAIETEIVSIQRREEAKILQEQNLGMQQEQEMQQEKQMQRKKQMEQEKQMQQEQQTNYALRIKQALLRQYEAQLKVSVNDWREKQRVQ